MKEGKPQESPSFSRSWRWSVLASFGLHAVFGILLLFFVDVPKLKPARQQSVTVEIVMVPPASPPPSAPKPPPPPTPTPESGKPPQSKPGDLAAIPKAPANTSPARRRHACNRESVSYAVGNDPCRSPQLEGPADDGPVRPERSHWTTMRIGSHGPGRGLEEDVQAGPGRCLCHGPHQNLWETPCLPTARRFTAKRNGSGSNSSAD